MAKDGGEFEALERRLAQMVVERRRSKADRFFQQKRTWSWTKDSILATYLKPYLEKLKTRGERILILEPYAGPGVFESGERGSPLIIADIAEKVCPGQYKAIFGNIERLHHRDLTARLKVLIDKGAVETYHLPAEQLLDKLGPNLGRQTVFLYFDPFGLPPTFRCLDPFLNRQKSFGVPAPTEILVNLPPSAIFRVAATDAASTKMTRQIKSLQNHLSQSLGNGYYWREVLARNDLLSEEQAELIYNEYRTRIKKTLPFSGMCPIREHDGAAIKYYMTFFSGHPDALRIYNDNMRSALRRGMYDAATRRLSLLEDVEPLDEDEAGQVAKLKDLIVEKLTNGGREVRVRLWLAIIDEHFLKFAEPSFNRAVRELRKEGRIGFEDIRKTKRLNDDAILYLLKGRPDDGGGNEKPPEAPAPAPAPQRRPLPAQIDVTIEGVELGIAEPARPRPDAE
jgi:three-Cys-motif partner protein